MKKFVTFLVTLILISCAGIGIKMSDTAVSVLSETVISGIGYYVAKNNPSHIDEMETWYAGFDALSQVDMVQKEWQHGQELLAKMVSKDPFIQSRIAKAMSMFELDYTGPQLPDEVMRYKKVVRSFMEGVAAFKLTL